MTVYIALLRAVNVGGTGTLPMRDLVQLCGELGFEQVRTYIQSGNVVFRSELAEPDAISRLETALTRRMGKPVQVMLRSASELAAVLAGNPFPEVEGSKVGVYFQADPVDARLVDAVVATGGERLRPGRREIYIHYPEGMGRSKLKLPAGVGTMRNMNTVAKLVAMATAQGSSESP